MLDRAPLHHGGKRLLHVVEVWLLGPRRRTQLAYVDGVTHAIFAHLLSLLSNLLSEANGAALGHLDKPCTDACKLSQVAG